GPVALALAGTQIMIVVTTSIASREDGWISALQYAFRLVHLPIGLVGVALGAVALAAASRRAAEGDRAGLDDVVRRGLRLNLLLRVASRKGHGPAAAPGTAFLAKTALATAALFGVAYGLSAAFLERGKAFSEGIPLVLGIAGATAVAGLVYLVAAKALTIPETSFMGRWISRRRSP